MYKYVIERDIPGIGHLTDRQLAEATRASNEVLREMAPDIQWLHSYRTADKLYCIYLARERELIHIHARRGGVPADRISLVTDVIDAASPNVQPREAPVAGLPQEVFA